MTVQLYSLPPPAVKVTVPPSQTDSEAVRVARGFSQIVAEAETDSDSQPSALLAITETL